MEEIVKPTVRGMRDAGCPYTGVLFAGLMIDAAGNPKLLEYNVRFGDPEAQVLMMRLRSDLLPVLEACAEGRLDEIPPLEWRDDSAMVVVMAANGYPGSYEKNSVIKGLDGIDSLDRGGGEVVVFHAGTALRRIAGGGGGGDEVGVIVSDGGRVLGVTALGSTLRGARDRAYEAVDMIDWPDGFCRRDIGFRAL